jgi:hypothetical protein
MAYVKSTTVVATSTVTVNAAFLQEIKEVNQELYQLLDRGQRICLLPEPSAGTGRDLTDLLAELRDQLALHFALEEAYGYFEDPVFVAPRLSELAGELRAQHRELYLEMADLVDLVDRLSYRGRLAGQWSRVGERFLRFHGRLQAHEGRENELILQAYDDDLGVGD